jgi:hypothetical protein
MTSMGLHACEDVLFLGTAPILSLVSAREPPDTDLSRPDDDWYNEWGYETYLPASDKFK